MSSIFFIGLGEHHIARKPGETIKAYSLGSCVGLCLLHKARGIYGMAHIVMPDSIVMPSQITKRPCYFVDTAVPFLLKEMLPGVPSNQTGQNGVEAILVGGAKVLKKSGTLNIGKRSIDALTLLLKHYKIPIIKSDVGGTIARSVTLDSVQGDLLISTPGRKERRL